MCSMAGLWAGEQPPAQDLRGLMCSVQLDHHNKGDEIQDYLKEITGKHLETCLSSNPPVALHCQLIAACDGNAV